MKLEFLKFLLIPLMTSFISPLNAQVLLDEEFDNVSNLSTSGWVINNLSNPVGTTSWFQGDPDTFSAYTGAPDSYAAADFNNTGDTGTISDWLITPTLALQNGEQISFYTQTDPSSLYPDNLELRLSTNGSSTNVGSTEFSVGDFSTLLLAVNPDLNIGGYPTGWTEYTATLTGLTAPTTGRFAFRYYVTDAGADGDNSDYIGIDSVVVTAPAVPEPSSLQFLMFSVICLIGWNLRFSSCKIFR